MDQVQFALWRFRNAEGVMAGVKRWNLSECELYINGKSILITYDQINEEAHISNKNDPFTLPITCPFKDFVKTMTALGYYVERPMIERHSLSCSEK